MARSCRNCWVAGLGRYCLNQTGVALDLHPAPAVNAIVYLFLGSNCFACLTPGLRACKVFFIHLSSAAGSGSCIAPMKFAASAFIAATGLSCFFAKQVLLAVILLWVVAVLWTKVGSLQKRVGQPPKVSQNLLNLPRSGDSTFLWLWGGRVGWEDAKHLRVSNWA